MGQSIYWHNITKGEYNQNCIVDATDNYQTGDKIMFSYRGNALMIDLETLSDGEDTWREYEWVKKEWDEIINSASHEKNIR